MRPGPVTPLGLAACVLVAAFAAGAFVSCGAAQGQAGEGEASGAEKAATSSAEQAGSDPRAAFESSFLLSGLDADIEVTRVLRGSRGSPRAGVALAFGSSIANAVAAGSLHSSDEAGRPAGSEELFSVTGAAAAPLPGPAMSIAMSGETVVVSCGLAGGKGALLGFRPDGDGGFALSWRREDRPRDRLLSTPGGRIAAGGEDGIVSVHDAADGRELWRSTLDHPVSDLAYAPGLVLVASGNGVHAFDESGGKRLWSADLASRAESLSAGSGVAAVLSRDGSLEAFVLADGVALCRSEGPYDPSVRAVVDAGRIIAALPRGGAREIELKGGTVMRSWNWSGPTSFLVADAETLYAGASGVAGPRIVAAPRSASGDPRDLPLPAPAFDSPAAAHGSRGGLLVLLQDGSVALATADAPPSSARTALDEAIAPPEPVASAISTALGRFRPRDPSAPASAYLRFDLLVSGMPVDQSVTFTAFRYDASASSTASFAAEPAVKGAIIALYDETGGELEANIDELGSRTSVEAKLQKGKSYWVAAGRSQAADPTPFRLFVR